MTQLTFGSVLRSPARPAQFAQVFIGLTAAGEFLQVVGKPGAPAPTGVHIDLMALAAVISFLVWFRRCRDNA